MKKMIVVIAAMICLAGCDVVRQVGGAYTLTQCEYKYNSISNLTLGGVDLSQGISLMQIPAVTSLLSGMGSSIPMDITLNLDVINPNATAAMLNGLDYILTIDNVQFTAGKLDRGLNVPAGGKETMPIKIGVDLKSLLSGDSGNAVLNIAKNFIGIGNEKSNVKLEIKPTVMVGSVPISTPNYIPVTFAFGGNK